MLEKLRALYQQQHQVIVEQIQTLYNQKKSIEAKRDLAEQKLLSGVLGDEDFVRLRTKFRADLDSIQNQIDELNNQKEFDVDVITEVVKLSRNIYKAYKTAPYELKRQYLGLFWDKFLVQDRKIIRTIPTKLIALLQQEQKVRLRSNWLPSPPLNLTALLEDYDYLTKIKQQLEVIKQLRLAMKV